jgi:hypothetical protein
VALGEAFCGAFFFGNVPSFSIGLRERLPAEEPNPQPELSLLPRVGYSLRDLGDVAALPDGIAGAGEPSAEPDNDPGLMRTGYRLDEPHVFLPHVDRHQNPTSSDSELSKGTETIEVL